MIALTVALQLAGTLIRVSAADHFTVRDAIAAEWARQPPSLSEAQRRALDAADRARLELTMARIGAPGAPPLLPVELANPTVDRWLAKAKAARTPRERFDALSFLNRQKRPESLTALAGLTREEAATWPRQFHLEAELATAQLNGGELPPELRQFVAALEAAGKVDPTRAAVAQLRLVLAGKAQAPRPLAHPNSAALLALFDAWAGAPWPAREAQFVARFRVDGETVSLGFLGVETPVQLDLGVRQRLFSALPEQGFTVTHEAERQLVALVLACARRRGSAAHALDRLAALRALGRLGAVPEARALAQHLAAKERDPLARAWLLSSLRALDPAKADELRAALLDRRQPNAAARAAAIFDLPTAPPNLAALTKVVWADRDLDSQQALLESYARWQLPVATQRAALAAWLQHPDWACRYEAYQALRKLDPSTPWPAAPPPNREQQRILRLAQRLAEAGRPVRLRMTFAGHPPIVLRLDPQVAPVNVANLVRLTQRGFFNGRRVPRVVPDFVVQMGSPYDTTDGGPGYTIRCEDSLSWYGPGSVGMALSGKDTGGSQLFITTNAVPRLTGKYTRVGEVEDPDRALPILDALPLAVRMVRVEVL